MFKRNRKKRGAATVEFAFVLPIFLMVVFGIVEFGRAFMVQQTLINASREGARQAIFPNSTSEKAEDAVIAHLAAAGITVTSEAVNVSPDPADAQYGDAITVTVDVPYADIAWIPGMYMQGMNLEASTTMSCETTQ